MQHFNGYLFELDCLEATVNAVATLKGDQLLKNLQEAGKFLWIAARGVMQMDPKSVVEYVARELSAKLKGAWKEWSLRWYGIVIAIQALTDTIVDDIQTVEEVQARMREAKSSDDWQVAYALLEALEKAAEKSTNKDVAWRAVTAIEDVTKLDQFWRKFDWKVREKVAESSVLLHGATTDNVQVRARHLYVRMKLNESDPHVRYTLDHAEELTAIQAALTKEWPQLEDEVSRQLKEQKQEIENLKQQMESAYPRRLKPR